MLKVFRRRPKRPLTPAKPSLYQRLPDATPDEVKIISAAQPFTMTSPERILSLIRAVEYLVLQGIPGDFVECGVWKGGSIVAMILTLKKLNATDRHIWLFDTFAGMSAPTAADVDFQGQDANRLLSEQSPADADSIWCRSFLSEVNETLNPLEYPADQLHCVVGPVERTLVQQPLPDQIALLRLDTDWYESTRLELQVLFPRLRNAGVLIIDDYGHWRGCRRAVDEYFGERNTCIHLQRIDYTGRLGIKCGPPMNTPRVREATVA